MSGVICWCLMVSDTARGHLELSGSVFRNAFDGLGVCVYSWGYLRVQSRLGGTKVMPSYHFSNKLERQDFSPGSFDISTPPYVCCKKY